METLFFVVESIVKSIVIGRLLTFFAYLTLAERRLLGRIQIRRGTNRVGPSAFFSP